MVTNESQRTVGRIFGKAKAAVLDLPGLRQLDLAEDEVFVRAGRPTGECYAVIDGFVAECSREGAGDMVRLVGPSGLLGLDELFAGRRVASRHLLFAATSVRLLAIPRDELEELAHRDAAVADELCRQLAKVAMERELRGQSLRGNNGAERIGALFGRFGWSDPPPVKWKTLTAYFGMNICALSRSLARLRKSRRL